MKNRLIVFALMITALGTAVESIAHSQSLTFDEMTIDEAGQEMPNMTEATYILTPTLQMGEICATQAEAFCSTTFIQVDAAQTQSVCGSVAQENPLWTDYDTLNQGERVNSDDPVKRAETKLLLKAHQTHRPPDKSGGGG